MNTYIITILLIFLCILLYRRYMPIRGISAKPFTHDSSTLVLDIRDYNETCHNVQSDLRIPHAYLKRHRSEIPDQKLHLIANNHLELNLSVRFLKRKGYQVLSYEILKCADRMERNQ